MKYVYLQDSVVHEIIPEYAPEFPNIPITARYTAEFLSHCVAVEDDMEVEQYDEYVNGIFKKPIAFSFDIEGTTVTYTVNTEGLPMITADETVHVVSAEAGVINFTEGDYGNIHIKFIATDGRQADYDVYVGEAPIEPEPVSPEKKSELEERVAALEAENEMISDVLDALLMGDLEV